jgi:hypothetical protein
MKRLVLFLLMVVFATSLSAQTMHSQRMDTVKERFLSAGTTISNLERAEINSLLETQWAVLPSGKLPVMLMRFAAFEVKPDAFAVQPPPPLSPPPVRKTTFPKLLGMQIGSQNYGSAAYHADMAKLDVVIIGFWRGWRSGSQTIRSVVQNIKRLNPTTLVGQYTVLNEWYDDPNNTSALEPRAKLTAQNWWLRKADGSKVQWTPQYNTWDINLTHWTTPDAAGMRYPQWRAQYDFQHFFQPVPEFDIWYFDNVMIHQRIATADWTLDGVDDLGTNPAIQTAFRKGIAAGWKAAKTFTPNKILMGNTDNDLGSPEYKGQLHAAFLEGIIGQSWSIETWGGWDAMMARYRTVLKNLQPPAMVGFNVMGALTDYRLFRYGYTSCLMDDGYFSYTDAATVYNSVPWFDEYEVKLGTAVDVPQIVAWQNGVYRRAFANGLVLLNPTKTARTVTMETGWKRFTGTQAPTLNNGTAVTTLTLQAKDGIVLVRQ